jgi:hypothetical protein
LRIFAYFGISFSGKLSPIVEGPESSVSSLAARSVYE